MSEVTAPVWPEDPQRVTERLNQPWRALVALVELGLAGLAVWASTLCWSSGVSTITMRLNDGTELVSTHYAGDWIAGAVGLGTLAILLVVDAMRQLLLAVRTRSRRHRKHTS